MLVILLFKSLNTFKMLHKIFGLSLLGFKCICIPVSVLRPWFPIPQSVSQQLQDWWLPLTSRHLQSKHFRFHHHHENLSSICPFDIPWDYCQAIVKPLSTHLKKKKKKKQNLCFSTHNVWTNEVCNRTLFSLISIRYRTFDFFFFF